MSTKKSRTWYEAAIDDWVRKLRGVNDPRIERQYAERQLGVTEAEKQIVKATAIYGGQQVPRLQLDAASVPALRAMLRAFGWMMPGVKIEEAQDVPARPPKTLRGALRDLGEGKARDYADRTLCAFCGARVRVPCTESRARNCANRARG